MNDVYVIGVATTPFKRWPETTHRTLTQWALDGVQKDAGVELSRADGVWFGNCALHVFGHRAGRCCCRKRCARVNSKRRRRW